MDSKIKTKHVYAPHERDHLEESPKKVLSCSKKDCVELPDNVTDKIICNNISNAEFDYTYNGGDDI